MVFGVWALRAKAPRKVSAFNKQWGIRIGREHFKNAERILGVQGPWTFSGSDFAALGCFSDCCLALLHHLIHSTRGILPLHCQILFVQKLSALKASTQEFPTVCHDADYPFFLHISLPLPFLLSVQVCYDFFTPSKTVLTFRYIHLFSCHWGTASLTCCLIECPVKSVGILP